MACKVGFHASNLITVLMYGAHGRAAPHCYSRSYIPVGAEIKHIVVITLVPVIVIVIAAIIILLWGGDVTKNTRNVWCSPV